MHHQGRSLSSSVPSRSTHFFLQGPLWAPSVIIEGGESVGNSKTEYVEELCWEWSATSPSDDSTLIRGTFLTAGSVEADFPTTASLPFERLWVPLLPDFGFLLANQ
jgi:hypothetical protein